MCIANNFIMSEEVPCFFEEFCSPPCHKVSLLYNGKSKLIPVRSMAQGDQEILWRRTGASPTEDAFICSYHHALLITKFQFLQKTCCRPFGKDTCGKRKGLQPITSATATKLQELTKRTFQPGQKLCPNCRVELKRRKRMQIVEPEESDIHPLEVITDERNKMSSEKRRYESSSISKTWGRDDVLRKQSLPSGKVDIYYYSRGMRSEASLVPPIRQTASIFKQPVTVHRTQTEGKVKSDFKHGTQEKPKQLFWEKRLEGLRACDIDGHEFNIMELPKSLKTIGPHIADETILQSVATALHISSQPVTGQSNIKTNVEKNPGVFINPEQPLVQAVNVSDEDIRKQEERVLLARRKLQEALCVH